MITSCSVDLFYGIIYCTSNGVHVISSLTSPQVSRTADCVSQKDFLGPLFKKLGNHSSFYEWNLGSNRTQKMAETSSHDREGQHSLTSVERPSYLRSDFVNV